MEKTFQSLDLQSEATAEWVKPDRYRDLENALSSKSKLIARGAGVSYVGASFGDQNRVVDVSRFDRILGFDPHRSTVTVEAGCPLGKISQFLEAKGWILPVQPGYAGVTVGGAIAINIFGKTSVQKGTFAGWVESIELFHPDHGRLTLSRDENRSVFDLTLGGFGLTGLIVAATLKIEKPKSLVLTKRSFMVATIEETITALEHAQSGADMVLTWNDFMKKGSGFGRGCVWVANWHQDDTKEKNTRPANFDLLSIPKRSRNYLNRFSLPLINFAYLMKRRLDPSETTTDYHGFSYPDGSQALYFSLFGKSGFVEKQMLIPWSGVRDYLDELQKMISVHAPPIALASLKVLRDQPRFLRFSGNGVIVSLDIANPVRHGSFLDDLDMLTTRFRGLCNLAKDSHVTRSTIANQYGEYEDFRRDLRSFDPKRRFSSVLSERLEL